MALLNKITLASLLLALGCGAQAQPDGYPLCVPSPVQLEWQRMEYYMFIHFGPNTFSDMEWGTGAEDPAIFAPTALDCRQWAATARQAGMKAIIVTAKHHDGFCLWPSAHSTHTVRESGWKEGRGDVLAELAAACRAEGIKLGVYLSPWDRNHPAYGTPEYNGIFAATLREVLTGYGDIFEVWLDGANGEGPNGRRQEYDWELFHKTIYECQPDAVIFSDVGPGCRWIGNEKGIAGETNWSRLDTEGFTPGLGAPEPKVLNQGQPYGRNWIPGEADVSIRPGWFYSPSTDGGVKSADSLMKIYYASVGRNANLLLNVPPDRTGRINPIDSARLMEFRREREAAFARNLAEGAVFDSGRTTELACHLIEQTEVIGMRLPEVREFSRLLLRENIAAGQNVVKWDAEYLDREGQWQKFTEGTTIGYKRITVFDPVRSDRIRINLRSYLFKPEVSGVELY